MVIKKINYLFIRKNLLLEKIRKDYHYKRRESKILKIIHGFYQSNPIDLNIF